MKIVPLLFSSIVLLSACCSEVDQQERAYERQQSRIQDASIREAKVLCANGAKQVTIETINGVRTATCEQVKHAEWGFWAVMAVMVFVFLPLSIMVGG